MIDVEAGGGGAAHTVSPLSKRNTASPLPDRLANGSAFSHHSAAGPSPALSSAARRQRGLQAAAGASYVVSSAALILLNKKVLVHYHFSAVHTLLFYHCL